MTGISRCSWSRPRPTCAPLRPRGAPGAAGSGQVRISGQPGAGRIGRGRGDRGRSRLQRAAADLERYRKLAAQKIVPAQQLDAAQAAFDAAAANLESARKQASAAGSQVSASGAAVRGADARLAAAQAAVDNARLQLGYARITAPVSGIIAKRNAETGAMVQPGQSLMSIVPDSNVWVTANLKETQLTNVRSATRWSLRSTRIRDGSSRGGWRASVPPRVRASRFSRPTTRPATLPRWCSGSRSKSRCEQPPATTPLRPGMSVDVTIETGRTGSRASPSAAAAK